MTILSRKRIRLAADATKRTTEFMKDIFTGATPELWRGNDVQFEMGIFVNDILLTDLSNIASLTIDLKDSSARAGTTLMTKTLSAGELTSCTDETWANGTAQHALVIFTGTESNLEMLDGNERHLWLVVSVVTNDSPGHSITIQATPLKLVEDGTGDGTPPPELEETSYTQSAADARFQQQHAAGASIIFKDGQHAYLYCAGDAKWYPIIVTLVHGTAVLGLGEGVEIV